MGILFALLSLALLQSAPAPVSPTPAPGRVDETVVVTARPQLHAFRRCLAQRCPPKEEVDAAMLAASEYFRAGNYAEARKLLRKTIGRNRKHAGLMPATISDLYATYGDISLHYGTMTDYRRATWASARVLSGNVGQAHPATLGARILVGDMLSRDDPRAGDAMYKSIAEEALAAGQTRLADMVQVRRAWAALLRTPPLPSKAEAVLREVRNPNDPAVDRLVRTMRIRKAILERNDAEADRLIGELRPMADQRQTLVYDPPTLNTDARAFPAMLVTGFGKTTSALEWVDIGFWVRPSGVVSESEVLRPLKSAGWAKPFVEQIAGRRYSPVAGSEPGDPGRYRIERITLRQDYVLMDKSRIEARAGQLRVIRADITDPVSEVAKSQAPGG